MKYLYIFLLLDVSRSYCQPPSFQKAVNWRLYDVSGSNLFTFTVDTLKGFPAYALSKDSILDYLQGVKELAADDAPVWMGGPHIASYEMDGTMHKIDISSYGGFFYDERTGKHFQIDDNKKDKWHSYIRACFLSLHR